jgi:hypothetical protein
MKPLVLLLFLAFVCGPLRSPAADKQAPAAKSAQPRPYVLSMCLVSDEKLAKDDPTLIYKDRIIQVCCDGCVKDFQKEPEKYLKLIVAAELKQAAEKVKQPKK